MSVATARLRGQREVLYFTLSPCNVRPPPGNFVFAACNFRLELETMSHSTALWEHTEVQRAQRLELMRRQALEQAKRKLQRYFARKRIRQVYLVGSVLGAGRFFPFSDIDVAVEGLEEPYFQVLADLEALLARDVDLIELERCRFREALQAHGLRLQ
jgi:predicted nucleotidyltransferase